MTEISFINISSYLKHQANNKPNIPAMIFQQYSQRNKADYMEFSLKELDELSDAAAYKLESFGICRGVRTVLMVTPSPELFVLTFALFKVGAVPVLVDPGLGIKNLGKCLAEAEPIAFIGIPKAHVARLILGWGKKTIKKLLTVGKRLGWGGKSIDIKTLRDSYSKPYNIAETKPDDIAAILFTSGNTGPAKGAVYTHGIFNSQVESIRSIYQIKPGEKDLSTFPLFALFGPALGMASVIPEMDASRPVQADPMKIITAIQDCKITNMFASPALIDKVGRFGDENNIKLPTLHRVISAGAPARLESLKRFSGMLNPGMQIFTPYGATEALPVCNIGHTEILKESTSIKEGKGICIGRPAHGIDLEIIKITDDPIESWSQDLVIPDGEIGEIAVKGPVVSNKYFNRPDLTNLAKIPDLKGGGFFHRMGDLGYKDAKGRIWYCGRKSQRVIMSEKTLYTIPSESVFNTHPKVFRSALVGVNIGGKQEPVLCVELENNVNTSEKNKIRDELLKLGLANPLTKSIKTLIFHSGFPVDIRHNAKIHREKLAKWAERRLS